MPVIVWRTLNGRSGIDVNNIVEAGETFQNTEMAESREKTLLYMTKQMDRWVLCFDENEIYVVLLCYNCTIRI